MVHALVVVGVVVSAFVVYIGVVAGVVCALVVVGVVASALVVCIVVGVAKVVCVFVVGGEMVSALVVDVADSKLESVLESKSAFTGVSHLVCLDCLLLCWCWTRSS